MIQVKPAKGWKAKGRGRGVGCSWYTSGMEASEAGKAKGPPMDEAPPGKGWGVGPGPNAEGKGCHKGGRKGKKKKSEMNEDEKELKKKRCQAAVIARRTDESLKATRQWINGFRTPVAHRWGHIKPKDCAHSVGNFSNILAYAVGHCSYLAQECFDYVHLKYDLSYEPATKAAVGRWLDERHFGDAQVIRELETERGRNNMYTSPLWEGGPTFGEFVGNSVCNFPPVSDDSNIPFPLEPVGFKIPLRGPGLQVGRVGLLALPGQPQKTHPSNPKKPKVHFSPKVRFN